MIEAARCPQPDHRDLAGAFTITAAEPLPDHLRQAIDLIHNAQMRAK